MTGPLLNLVTSFGENKLVFLERPATIGAPVASALPCQPGDSEFLRLDDPAVIEDPPPDMPVVAAGLKLFQALTQNAAVDAALKVALSNREPIYLRMAPNDVDQLPWESLHDGVNGFFALDPNMQIARVAQSPQSMHECAYDPPLRLLVVLGAADVSPESEWNGLRAALQASPVPVETRVLVSDDAVRSAIEQAGDPATTAESLADKRHLLNALVTFKPHLIHFFCHGYAGGAPYLEIETRLSREGGDNHIALESRELEPLIGNVWAIVLNCCEGAAPSGNTGSLAFSLASQGFPAVIAMRRAITVADANAFSGSFYPTLFQRLGEIASAKDDVSEVVWSSLLYSPRRSLCDRHGGPPTQTAQVRSEWTLPVLYLGRERTILRKPPTTRRGPAVSAPDAAYERAKLETLLRALNELHPSAPEAIKTQIKEEIDTTTAFLAGDATR